MNITHEQTPIHICGGNTDTKPADKKIQQICDQVKPQAEKKAGIKFGHFTAVSYNSGVVAGTKYSIKVDVGGNKYVHISVWEKLPCNGGGLELTGIEQHKSQQDPLE